MTNLIPDVIYYVRAFAVTNTGTVYGNEVGFSTTGVSAPVVLNRVVNVTAASAKAWGNVTNYGYAAVTERGFCWGTGHNPTVSGTHIACGSGTGYFNHTLTGLTSNSTYYLRAYAVSNVGTTYGDEVEFHTSQNGGGGSHEYVDLGLPSGLLWATCNVGANVPEEYGDYFAWGETSPKDYYDWSTYQYCNGSYNTLTKYCDSPNFGYNGFTDNLTILLPEDDAAAVNWGNGWRMPTQEEWEELCENTTSTWTTQNGVGGRLYTAPNGNSLFLPASGSIWLGELMIIWYSNDDVIYSGYYWSSSLHIPDYPDDAWSFYSGSDNYSSRYSIGRIMGHSVRPVRSSHQN